MKMRELIILQLLGIVLFAVFSFILYKMGVFNLTSAIVVYAIMGIGNVVNARIQLMKPIEEMGFYDDLTGFYNRTKLSLKKKEYQKRKSYAVVFFDLNNLKRMNDDHGHDDGDKMLMDAATQLKFWDKYGDMYRIGGDEFLAVIPELAQEKLDPMLKQWIEGFPVLNKGYGDDFVCDLSYGAAYKDPADHVSFEDMMNKADEAMYRMKQETKAK